MIGPTLLFNCGDETRLTSNRYSYYVQNEPHICLALWNFLSGCMCPELTLRFSLYIQHSLKIKVCNLGLST
jgi:hypothetical protein